VGRGLLQPLGQFGSPGPFSFSDLFLFFFFSVFTNIFPKTTPNQILKPLLKITNFPLCLVKYREVFEKE
jgi:hypothetical protein